MFNKRSIGNFGEEIAALYLKKKKYIILEQNYQISGGEIDIIAKQNNFLVFCEVKYRESFKFGGGASAVNKSKKANIIYTAEHYLYANRENAEITSLTPRFDVIEIYPQDNDKKPNIIHNEAVDITNVRKKKAPRGLLK